MQNVPKIVTARLKVAAPSAVLSNVHPDADVLTAFAEQSLPRDERATVMGHLSACADCREIVAMALPEDQAAASLVPIRRTWFTLPVIRWGFAAAACFAVVASVGILQLRRNNQATRVAKVGSAGEAIASPQSAPAPPPPVSAEARSEQGLVAKKEAKPKGEWEKVTFGAHPNALRTATAPTRAARASSAAISPMGAQNSTAYGTTIGGPAHQNLSIPINGRSFTQLAPLAPGIRDEKEKDNNKKENAPAVLGGTGGVFQADAASTAVLKQQPANGVASAAPPAATEAVEVNPAITTVEVETQNQVATNEPPKTDLPVNGRAVGTLDSLAKSKSVASPAASPAMKSVGAAVAVRFPAPLWSIDSAGNLQRSFDAGKTWQVVNVYASAAASMLYSANMVAESQQNEAQQAEAEKKLNDKDLKRQQAKARKREGGMLVFRAVAAMGSEVWAGGNGGALYYSRDAGGQWNRVVPSANGVGLTGDVIGLDFSEPQTCKVTTSTSEIWITADDGQSWKKQ